MAGFERNAEARIEDGKIVIEVAIDSLPVVVEASWACGVLNPRYRVTNARAFAEDLVLELNREECEDGTTPVHALFDKAIGLSIEAGAQGIEEHPERDA